MNPPEPLDQLLINAKLERPYLPRGLLQRASVGKKFTRSLNWRVTLVSAPAGYGKSTLVAQLLGSDDAPSSAWLSLESLDSDLRRFLRYFIAALREVAPDCLTQTEQLLGLEDFPSPQYLAESTVAELERLEQRVVVVLDDYHLVQSPEVHKWLESIVSKLPRTVHLVVISRIDPPLPLSLWRSRHWLGELRLADLRFSLQEAQKFLKSRREYEFGDEHIATIHRKTDGWITAMRLFLLSAAGSSDVEDRVHAFSARDPLVIDYFLEEILADQPPEIMQYLGFTALLERFSPKLTDELLSEFHPPLAGKSQEIVDRLVKTNLFLVPSGTEDGWYRYHPLLRELLLNRFDRIVSQVKKEGFLNFAGQWLQREGYIEDALRCYLAASDLDAATDLIGRELHDEMIRDPSRRTLRRLLEMFPVGAERSRAPLLIAWAYTKSIRWDHKGVRDLLEQVELTSGDAEDNERWRSEFQPDIDYLQCFASLWGGNVEKAYEHGKLLIDPARRAHESLEPFWPRYYAASLALTGRRAEFQQFIEDGLAGAGSSGLDRQWPFIAANAFIQLCWGDLTHCQESASQLLAEEPFPTVKKCQQLGHLFLGMVAYERNQLDEAEGHFKSIVAMCSRGRGFACWDALVGLIWIDLTRGRMDSAWQRMAAARDFAMETKNLPLMSASTAIEQRISMATARPHKTSASRPSERDFTWSSIIPPSQNWAWLQLQSPLPVVRNDALEFIDAALNHADKHGVVRRVIQLSALRAVALDSLDRRDEALAVLRDALQQGANLGFVRSFIDAGEEIRPLLHALAEQDDEDSSIYAAMLLDALDARRGRPARREKVITAGTLSSTEVKRAPIPVTAHSSRVVSGDQLTNRELDVLELLRERLSNKEIASELCISPTTVKMHSIKLYRKLGVHCRRKAVSAAIELGILSQ